MLFIYRFSSWRINLQQMMLEVKVCISHIKTQANLFCISISAILLSVPHTIYKSLGNPEQRARTALYASTTKPLRRALLQWPMLERSLGSVFSSICSTNKGFCGSSFSFLVLRCQAICFSPNLSLCRWDCLISIQYVDSEDIIVVDKRSNSALSVKAIFSNVFATNDP